MFKMLKIGDLVKHSGAALIGRSLIGIVRERHGMVFTVLWLDEQGGLYDYEAHELELLRAKQ